MNTIFQKRRARLLAMKALRDNYLPPDQVLTCPKCNQEQSRKEVAKHLSVCPGCGYHWPMGAYYRLSSVLDSGSFRELNPKLHSNDPISFPGYQAKLEEAGRKTGLSEAIVTAVGTIQGRKCVVGVMDSRVFMGSMSAALGEKVTRAIEYAEKQKLPLIFFCASGGARMQEGILSLMQMAKTSAVLAKFSEKGLLYFRTDQSHYRRRDRQFCVSGRHHSGGTRGSNRVCGPAGHRANHRREAAGGLSAGRIPAGTRFRGCGGSQREATGDAWAASDAPRQRRSS